MNNTAIKPYEDWVIRNKKFIIDWVKQNDKVRLDDIRNAFNTFERATSNKSKLKAFDELKRSLHTRHGKAFSDLIKEKYEPAKKYAQEMATLKGDGTIESIPRNTDNEKLNKSLKLYDLFNEMSSALSTLPSKPKDYSYVELDKAFQDNYDYDEMVALANQYNYDWTDKEDRKEFIKTLSEIEQARLKEDAYTPHDAAGMLTQLAYPVTLEHARKTDEISPYSVIADLATQATMMEGPTVGKMLGGKVGEGLGGLVAAPALTEYGQIMTNDKPVTDALQDVGAGTVLNSIAPGTIMGMASRFYRPGTTPNATARALANKYADDYRTMIRLQHEQPYRFIPKDEQAAYINGNQLKYIVKEAEKLVSENPGMSVDEAIKQASSKNLADAETYVKRNAAQLQKFKESADQKTGKTGVYKKNWVYQTNELTPEQVLKSPDNVMQITPEMQAKEQMLYRWRKKNRPQGTDEAKYRLAMKKANNEPITVDDLVKAGYTESALHKIYNGLKHTTTEPIKSLGLNLGAANRLADKRIEAFGRNVNLPWNYGESEPEIDWDDPKVKAYKAAYERYKSNEELYQKPKKPAGLKNETVEKIEKIFGD